MCNDRRQHGEAEGRPRRLGLQDESPSLDSRMRGKPAHNRFAGADRIIHHVPWEHLLLRTFVVLAMSRDACALKQ
jgi:hypothetical protein